MDEAIAALMAKPEVYSEVITVQHVLIAFKGASKSTVERSKEEAKALAEKVWREALAGADFKALMRDHSTDPGGGEYAMTKAGRATQMVAGFADVSFRLEVGEIGVAAYDEQKSPFGWHIIKRVK